MAVFSAVDQSFHCSPPITNDESLPHREQMRQLVLSQLDTSWNHLKGENFN